MSANDEHNEELLWRYHLQDGLLARLGHALRNPLGGIVGATELFGQTDLNAVQRECLEIIRESCRALTKLAGCIDEVRIVLPGQPAPVGQPTPPEVREDFSPRALLEEAIAEFASETARKKLQLTVSISPDCPQRLYGEVNVLRQVLRQLLSNAVKFTESGSVTAQAALAQESNDEALVLFEILDTGVGIQGGRKAGLLDGSLSADQVGCGLGLVLCRYLVATLHGRMGFHSRLGKGSTFWFSVPLQRFFGAVSHGGPVAESHVRGISARHDLAHRGGLAGRKILLVEDGEMDARLFVALTADWGVTVERASSAAEAERMIRDSALRAVPYDIAVLDFMLPDTDGVELARRLRADPASAGLTLVILTGDEHHDPDGQTLAAGVAGYLRKPVDERRLYEYLAMLVGDGQKTLASLTSPRVLVVEDDAVGRRVTVRMLENCGCLVDEAGSAEEGLLAFERVSYAAIFMDCRMNGMDGFAATAVLRDSERGRHVPVIAITGGAGHGDRERCLAAGMDDYLPKPFGLEALDVVLKRWTDRDQAG